jgi:hypothetical protein
MTHDRPVAEICYSPDGSRILTACWSGKSRLWDAATGRPLTEWLDGGGFGRTAGFDATGTRIVTGSDNGIVRIWDVPAVPTPVPGWFVEFAESVAGMRLTSRGNAEWVPRRELEALSQRLARESEGDFYVHLGRWFLANPSHRSASPF